ncbi:MAG: adenosylmethionine--8-amino-7-oxononanoate transaminase [Planctomycetota bacterium]|nr:MAG: adenosylmethionine--8-amino-7-oxononanoate transaminase [Planctomycetota bacterium]REK30196.1 MAG: adenosylmethionine--8-amino-7-oxononanoate transaminase [Planctomycetota bacterium]REK49266.1 MAG: adenosylmethionine--8-amino-7-oxononanoate transaminase [Planctomycetota bacterium]
MKPTPSELEAWDRDVVWHGFTPMAEYEPLVIDRAEGCTLIDVNGRRLLDGVSSLWCNVHGHRHPKIDAAVREQLDKIAHCTSLGMGNSTTAALARRLVDVTPEGLEHVFFASDGASSVEAALKMAFQYWRQRSDPRPQKTKFVALGEAYHGDTIGSVSVGGIDLFHDLFRPLLFEVLRLPVPDTYRLPAGVAAGEACDFYTGQVEELLASRHEEIAALVVEPLVQGAAGMIMQPQGYLRRLRELTRQYDILLIADEVATGFGRTGTMFACEQEEVAPDLMCLGKGLTGGYLAMSTTLASDEVFQAFDGTYADLKHFFHGHTYGGNPLAAAAALATLKVFDEEDTLASLPEKIACVQEHLVRIAELRHVGSARQRGLMVGIELVADRATREPFPWQERRAAQACRAAIEQGVWLRPLGDVIIVMPPLAMSIEELDQVMLAAEQGIVAATAA